jgi:Protein  of unknown function (DUF3018)
MLHVIGEEAIMSNKDAVKKHRGAMRAAGLRPVQIWVPDTRNPRFIAEAHRQSSLIGSNPDPQEDAFMDAALADLLKNDE